jgi:FMN phosphatase YigB (HAD superfamily)
VGRTNALVEVIFIDDGGVMNENARRGAEWRRLVGEFFHPLLGGEKSRWADANRQVFGRLEPMLIDGPGDREYLVWFRDYQVSWLKGMAEFVGVECPTEEESCLLLAREASDFITQRVRSEFPGAPTAIRELTRLGFTLHTASGENSWELDGYLRGMGIRECFGMLFGSDLINKGKYSVDYYGRLFEETRLNPRNTLIVDDSPKCLSGAASLGAKTCLVSAVENTGGQFTFQIHDLEQLPRCLERARAGQS